MDFQTAVIESVNKLAESGHIEKHIDAAVSKTVSEIISDELKSYSDFGKKVKEIVKQAIGVDGLRCTLPEYNDLIVKIVSRQVDAALGKEIERQVTENLKEILSPIPEQITVQELVDQLKEKIAGDRGCHCHGEEPVIRIEIDEGSGSTSKYWHLYLDDGEAKASAYSSKYSYKYQLGIDDEGRVYSVSFGGQDIDKRIFLGPYYGFEQYLLALKTCRARITKPNSVEDIDTYVEAAFD